MLAEGCRAVVSCYWCTATGHGGPTLPASQMRELADVDVELYYDFYGPYDED